MNISSTREPKELFDTLDLLLEWRNGFQLDVLWSLAQDLHHLKVRKIPEDNRHRHPRELTINTGAIPDQGDLTRDTSFCRHANLWKRPENRGPSVMSNTLWNLRTAAQKLAAATALAKNTYALWRGAGWNVDNRDALIVLLETLEAIEKYFEDGVLDPLRSDLRYLGCINGCNGSWIPVSLDRPRPQPPKTQPYARTFNQSQACQKVIESLEKTRIALLETDDRIMELHHFSRIAWEVRDQNALNQSTDSESGRTEADGTTEAGPPPSDGARPITTFPPEVFSQVVGAAAMVEPQMLGIVGGLNRYTNNVTEGTPSLWSTIHIMYPIEELKKRLKKSKNTLLHFNLSLAPSRTPQEGITKYQAFYGELTTHVLDRLRSFEAITTEEAWSGFAINILRTSTSRFPQLRALSIGLVNSYHGPMAINGFAILSNLVELSVHWIEFQDGTLPAFPHLLKLNVEGCMTQSFDGCLGAICTMTSLQCLSLRDIHGSSIPTTSVQTPVVLSTLLKIEAELVGVPEIKDLFGRVHPANLQSLIISPWPSSPSNNDDETLEDVLQANASGVLELHLLNCDINRWRPVLTSLSAVTHLRIASCAIGGTDLAVLGGSTETQSCPDLAHLVLDNIPTVSSGVIRRVIEERNTSGRPVQSLILWDCNEEYFDDDDVEEMEKLVANFKIGELGLDGVFDDPNASFGNTSSADDSFGSGDVSWSCMTYIPLDWLTGNLSDRWMKMRSERLVYPTFPRGVSNSLE